MGGASMGGSAGAGPTSFNGPGNGSVSGGTGHGSHSGHSSSVTGAHGTVVTSAHGTASTRGITVAHDATKAVAKDPTNLNQFQFHRAGFTSDTMIERPVNGVRVHQESSTGGFTPETYKKKRKIYHPIQSNAGNAQNAVIDR